MPLSHEKKVEICLKERGYIVLASAIRFSVGYILRDKRVVLQPFVIIATTDKQDAIEQQKLLYKHGDYNISYVQDDPYYYRLTTD